jgi:hypothetical protein
MKIDPISSLRAGAVRRGERARTAAGESFAAELADEPSAAAVSAPQSMGGVEALLALQEVTEEGRRRQPPKARALAILDQLEEVRVGLLLGFIPRDRLERLGQLAQGLRGEVSDPRLADILAEIELRARVELAKLGQPA